MEREINTIVVPFRDKNILHSILVEYLVTDGLQNKDDAELTVRFIHPVTHQKHQVKQQIDQESAGKEAYLKGVAFALTEDYLKRKQHDDISVIP